MIFVNPSHKFLDPRAPDCALPEFWHTGRWPVRWLLGPEAASAPHVMAFRCMFTLDSPEFMRLYVSADERYILYSDGVQIGRGPERGDPAHWFFETYVLDLPAGEHTLVAWVWALGDHAPLAQFSVEPGLIVAGETEAWQARVGTGVASWDVKSLDSLAFSQNRLSFGVGDNVEIDGGVFDRNFVTGAGDGWSPARVGSPGYSAGGFDQHGVLDTGHWLAPATLPAMHEVLWDRGRVRYVTDTVAEGYLKPNPAADRADEHTRWDALLAEQTPLVLPAHATCSVLLDFDDYVCAYTRLELSGGAGTVVRVRWAEALYESEIHEWWDTYHGHKGNRDEVFHKTFTGEGDVFRPAGGTHCVFENFWWRAGRYVLLEIRTAGEPLVFESLAFLETRYPLEAEGRFDCDSPGLTGVWPLMTRALQMCSHETYMDCPYYEQLMYVGDTRLEILATYCLTHDDRLPRKAIALFDASRFPGGLTQSRYPCRATQVIPPFSLWWCGMVYDYALWRDDAVFVRAMMPGVHAVMDAFLAYRNADGLVEGPPGWNYVDWTTDPAWIRGVPPDGQIGVSAPINWHFVYTLNLIAQLDAWLGEPEAAARAQRYARKLAQAASEAFWDASRGLYADTLDRHHFSEHTQCLALLSGQVEPEHSARVAEGLLTAQYLTRTTIYFSHYLLETYRLLGRDERIFARLEEWFELPAMGFKTTREKPEPSRSDCHAWGAHPIYHAYASILGIRPDGMGFRRVIIEPLLGPLTRVDASLPHPQGELVVQLETTSSGGLGGNVTLPGSVSGSFSWEGQTCELLPGTQTVYFNARARHER